MSSNFRLFPFVISIFSSDVLCEFSEIGKNFILNRHNELRSEVALGKYLVKSTNTVKEPASNMLKLYWDDELEESAQKYSIGCPSVHSANRGDIGENMYWWTSPVITEVDNDSLGNRSSNLWASEFQKYGWTENILTDAVFNTGIGHASQMSWAKSRKIGCGVSRCTSLGTQYLVVCHYSPAGNYIGNDIYQSGTTCSECPDGTSCESETGLCR